MRLNSDTKVSIPKSLLKLMPSLHFQEGFWIHFRMHKFTVRDLNKPQSEY